MNSLSSPFNRRNRRSTSTRKRGMSVINRDRRSSFQRNRNIRKRSGDLMPTSASRRSSGEGMRRDSSSNSSRRSSRSPSREIRFPAISDIGGGSKRRRMSFKGGRKMNRERSRSNLPAQRQDRGSDRELESLRRKIALQEKREDELLKRHKASLKSTGLDFGKFKKARWVVFKKTMEDFTRLHPKSSLFLKEYRSEMERTFEHLKVKMKKSKELTEKLQRQLKRRERELLLEIDQLGERSKLAETKEIELDLLIKSLHRQIKILHRQVKEQKNKNRAILEMMSKIRTEDPINVCVELINENEKQVTREKSLQQTINALEKRQRRLRSKVSVQKLESLQATVKEEKLKCSVLEKDQKVSVRKIANLKTKIRKLRTQEKSSTPRPDWKEYEGNSTVQEILIREGHVKSDKPDQLQTHLDDDDDDEESEKGTTRSMIRSIIWNHLKLEKQYVLLSSLGKGSGGGGGTSPGHRYLRDRGRRRRGEAGGGGGGRMKGSQNQGRYQSPSKYYSFPKKTQVKSSNRMKKAKSTQDGDDQGPQGSGGETMQILDYIDELGENMVKKWECLRHRKWINGFDHQHIPQRFHVEAKIRRVFIPCETAKFLVRQYWDMKLKTENGGRSIELRKEPVEFLQTFLKKKYGTATSSKLNRRVVSEWAYSLHTVLNMMKGIDPDCDMFRKIIYEALNQDVYYTCHWEIEKLRNAFRKISESSEHLSGKIALTTLQRSMEDFFPLKDAKKISSLMVAIEFECGMNLKYVNYKRLFRVDEISLEPTSFVSELKSQFIHQRRELINEIEEHLISQSDFDNDGKVTPQQLCETLIVVYPALPVKMLDRIVMESFLVQNLENLEPTFVGNRRKYTCIGIEDFIASIIGRLKRLDVKRFTHDSKTLQYLNMGKSSKKNKM